MLFAWLLPDSSYVVLFEDWRQQPYSPRHCKSPLLARVAHSVAGAISVVRERYADPDGNDGLPSEAHPALLGEASVFGRRARLCAVASASPVALVMAP